MVFDPGQQMMGFVEIGSEEEGFVIEGQVGDGDIRPIEVRIHGEWWLWVWVVTVIRTEIDSSALGDGKSQSALECTGMQPLGRAVSGRLPHGRRMAQQIGQSSSAILPENEDWTG